MQTNEVKTVYSTVVNRQIFLSTVKPSTPCQIASLKDLEFYTCCADQLDCGTDFYSNRFMLSEGVYQGYEGEEIDVDGELEFNCGFKPVYSDLLDLDIIKRYRRVGNYDVVGTIEHDVIVKVHIKHSESSEFITYNQYITTLPQDVLKKAEDIEWELDMIVQSQLDYSTIVLH